MARQEYVEIADSIFWVGSDLSDGLQCNPYLILDDGEDVLIDPGSVLDFEAVYNNIVSITNLEKIKYVVLSHQDPDLCSSMPLFERRGLKAKIVTHWRSSVLQKYYGIKSEFYHVNENGYQLVLNSGRTFKFIHTPYLHFPGSIVTYDQENKVLFSSDLFGAFSSSLWHLFADDNYIEPMKAFHEHYMPGNDILRPVMELLSNIDISIIAPQHGSIIKNNVKMYIKVLKELECGTFLHPIKRELSRIGGYTGICNQVLKRMYDIFGIEEVKEIFKDEIEFEPETNLILDHIYTGLEIWDKLFEIIYAKKGLAWLSVIETMVSRTAIEYNIELPSIFKSTIFTIQKETELLSQENLQLKEINEGLKRNLDKVNDQLTKCPLTNFYNENFFFNYLKSEIETGLNNKEGFFLLLIEIDHLAGINFDYGRKAADEVLHNVGYLLNETKEDFHLIFRLEGPVFAYYIPGFLKANPMSVAEKIRRTVDESNIFIQHITVSIGLVGLEEFFGENNEYDDLVDLVYKVAKTRLVAAKKLGMNIVCATSSIGENTSRTARILIVDSDEAGTNALKVNLEQHNCSILTCSDGEQALEIMESESPDLVVSEIMVPKIDGFMIREKMLYSSSLKNIPFIILSYQKNEASIQRALTLKTNYYFKKPYSLYEVVGIIVNKLKSLETDS